MSSHPKRIDVLVCVWAGGWLVGLAEIDALVTKITEEVSALESRGGEQGAENSDYTFLAAVETAPQFSCTVCGNKVRHPLFFSR